MPRPHEHSGHRGAPRRRFSRRQFLIGAGGAAGAAALGAGALEAVQLLGSSSLPKLSSEAVRGPGHVRSFHTLPHLRPAAISVARQDPDPEGYLFLGPWSTDGNQSGPQMVDRFGDPVWFDHVPVQWASNFRTWTYRGEPVLVWWQGIVRSTGFGQGEAVIVDSSYREVARVRAANGHHIDLHELTLSPEGTALFTCYPNYVDYDLSVIGGPQKAKLVESVFQEVDIRTGRLLLEWRSLDHIPVRDSYNGLAEPYDYLHLNSIEVLPDGNLLVSGRYTWSLYKLHRRTGEVMWRLGGKRTQFRMGSRSQFSWQHHASQPQPGTITVFDNGSNGPITTETRSRGVRLAVDERARTVELAQSYTHHPKPVLAQAMGSVQLLPDGNVQVGWGEAPYVSEFDEPGEMVNDARMLSGYKSYRCYRLPWTATPHYPPAISAHRDPSSGRVTLYASWNGATEVAFWKVHAGPRRSDLRPIGVAPRAGFETAIPLGRGGGFLSASALDGSGRTMGTSAPIKI